jgi:hypothetical protein
MQLAAASLVDRSPPLGAEHSSPCRLTGASVVKLNRPMAVIKSLVVM